MEEVEIPQPGPGEVRIRVEAASLNHLDLWVRRGLPFEIPMPHIGGSDFAGTVDEVGPGADPAWVGKRVVADPSVGYGWYETARSPWADPAPFTVLGEHTQGGFADFVLAPAANLVELTEAITAEVAAAAALAGVTAWRGLFSRGNLAAGERVLITGASGGVSSLAVQYAKLAGAEVYAVTSTPENVEKVRNLGADHVFDRLASDWGRELHQATGRKGVDLCLDSVGAAIWGKLVRSLTVGGRLVSFGATTGADARFDIRRLFWFQLSFIGTTMGSPAEFLAAMHPVFSGSVVPPIHKVLPLAEARAAHELLEAGEVFGKVVLRP